MNADETQPEAIWLPMGYKHDRQTPFCSRLPTSWFAQCLEYSMEELALCYTCSEDFSLRTLAVKKRRLTVYVPREKAVF